jgi:hypothetical protein
VGARFDHLPRAAGGGVPGLIRRLSGGGLPVRPRLDLRSAVRPSRLFSANGCAGA